MIPSEFWILSSIIYFRNTHTGGKISKLPNWTKNSPDAKILWMEKNSSYYGHDNCAEITWKSRHQCEKIGSTKQPQVFALSCIQLCGCFMSFRNCNTINQQFVCWKHFETRTNEVVSRFWRKSRRFIKAVSPPALKRAFSPSSWSEEHLFGSSWRQSGLFVITVLSLHRIDFW